MFKIPNGFVLIIVNLVIEICLGFGICNLELSLLCHIRSKLLLHRPGDCFCLPPAQLNAARLFRVKMILARAAPDQFSGARYFYPFSDCLSHSSFF